MVTTPVVVSLDNAGTHLNLDLAPELADFQGYASYTALFDQYRFTRLTFHFQPSATVADVSTNYSGVNVFAIAPDWDDITAVGVTLTDLANLMSKPDGAVHSLAGNPWTFSFAPRVKRDVQADAGYETAICPWLSTSDAALALHGIKCWIGNPLTGTATKPGMYWWSGNVEFRGQHISNLEKRLINTIPRSVETLDPNDFIVVRKQKQITPLDK